MIKIDSIRNIRPLVNSFAKDKLAFARPPFTEKALAYGACGVLVSTFFKDYRNTEDKNFFQFKIDENTGLPFKPDIFQQAAGMNILAGNDVLVTAPTGTGKTAIAEYAITNNLNKGLRTFYTTPLKALSNEKFLEFSKIFGKENVGLITGDTKINTNAPIIVMTTEVFRNMAATEKFNLEEDSSKGIPKGVRTVIFDELQYLGDVDRGGIWEQSIILTPPNIQILSLSATIGNNEEINSWIASTKNRHGVAVTPQKGYKPNLTLTPETILINVPPENRHVPLNYEIEHAVAEIKIPRGGTKAEKIKAKKEGARISQSVYAKPKDESYKNLTKKLNNEGKLPAIYFVFSKKESRHLLKYLSTESELLTSENERFEIAKILKRYLDEGIYLGESLNIDALMKGYAVHNAGLLPAQKRLIEELFQKKLVKVVIATETLSAGINMPAKTTVISSPRKPASTSDGGDDNKRNLTPNEFHQMAGRAGRRGIDTVGYCYSLSCNQEQNKIFNELMSSPSNKLESNLELDFSFICNYLEEFNNEDELKYILSKSLYTFENSNKIKELMANFDIKKNVLAKENFIDSDGHVTSKGHLLKLLNGYEQIPIINIMTDKTLIGLEPKEIAGFVGGIANIEYNTMDDLPQKPFNLKRCYDEEFNLCIGNLLERIRAYDKSTKALHPDRQIKVDSNTIEHLYLWAELNEKDEDSRKNWKELYSGELKGSIKDEGTLFKEITMTTDLLKQMIEVAEYGKNISENIEEKNYYKLLVEKLNETLKLIQKEPANDSSL